ncbi:MAG: LysR family transcriptional regulator [Alphaproteobacteria bacterium]|nr:LysR family transcriptional regulator [Alphaproteobacteria bacterium]
MARRHLPTIERLRTLREVARLGSFSAAARTLGLTQPAVSNQIRLLEQQLGSRLLERIGKSAKATPEGELLIEAASRAFAEIDTAIDEIARRGADISGSLVMAAGATATKYLLPPVMADLRARHPAIDLRVLTGNTADMLPGLLDGSIDLGLLTGPLRRPDLRTRLFFRDRLVCIVPPAEAPAVRTLRSRDLSGRQLVLYDRGGSIRYAIDRWLGATRQRVRISDIGSADAQAAFVRAGLGWSIISEIAAREDADAGRIDLRALVPPLSRDLVLAWRADRADRPVIAASLAIFGSHAASLAG